MLEIADLLPFRDHPKVIGLAEFMNFPGVLATDPGVIDKLLAFQDGHIDGHAPLLSGLGLNGYLAAGIRTDHEATSASRSARKARKGMAILIREGSVSKDLNALAEMLDENTSAFVALCTDDRNPLDISEEGHLDCADPPADRQGAAAASCLSRRLAFGGADFRAQGPRPCRAGLARRYRAARQPRRMRGQRCRLGRPAGGARAVSLRASRSSRWG